MYWTIRKNQKDLTTSNLLIIDVTENDIVYRRETHDVFVPQVFLYYSKLK